MPEIAQKRKPEAKRPPVFGALKKLAAYRVIWENAAIPGYCALPPIVS
jgi:hypothetical protein